MRELSTLWVVLSLCGLGLSACGSDSDAATGAAADAGVGGSADAGVDGTGGDSAIDSPADSSADTSADSAVDSPADDSAPDTGVGPGLLAIGDLEYQGAFRVAFGDDVSDTNYAVGTLAYNPSRHSLFIAGHAQHNAIAEFAIPQLGTSSDVTALPAVETSLQPFRTVLDASANGNPEGVNRVTGMLWIEGQLLVNAENWYDAGGTNRDTTLVVRDATDLAGEVDGFFELEGAAHAGGYLAPVPAPWQSGLGGAYLTGWASNYSIVSRYSVGPSLFGFNPSDILEAAAGAQGSVATHAVMDFPHAGGHYMGADALVTEQGSAPALWNFLSRGVYGFVVPGTRTFAVFGSSGGIDSGIGYKITQSDGNLCGGYCAYDADDYSNYYWFFDLEEVLAAGEVYAPRPYAYGRWTVPFDDGGKHPIIGGAFDFDDGMLYLSLAHAGQVGEYDRPPVIVVFRP